MAYSEIKRIIWGVEFKNGVAHPIREKVKYNPLTEACKKLFQLSEENKNIAADCRKRLESIDADVEGLTKILNEFRSFLEKFNDTPPDPIQ